MWELASLLNFCKTQFLSWKLVIIIARMLGIKSNLRVKITYSSVPNMFQLYNLCIRPTDFSEKFSSPLLPLTQVSLCTLFLNNTLSPFIVCHSYFIFLFIYINIASPHLCSSLLGGCVLIYIPNLKIRSQLNRWMNITKQQIAKNLSYNNFQVLFDTTINAQIFPHTSFLRINKAICI